MCHALRDTEDIWMCEMNDNILLIYVKVVFSSKAKSNSTKQLSIHYNLLILSWNVETLDNFEGLISTCGWNGT